MAKRVALLVGELQAGLAAVGPRQPAQVVIEGAVLHHQHHEGVDRQVAGRGERHLALAARGLGDERVGVQDQTHGGGQAGRDGGPLEEVTPRVKRVGGDRPQPLGLERIAKVTHGSGS